MLCWLAHNVGVCRWRILSYFPRSLGLIVKALMQALWLLAMLLFWMPSPDVILLQVLSISSLAHSSNQNCSTMMPAL